jgi:hypothetical protein
MSSKECFRKKGLQVKSPIPRIRFRVRSFIRSSGSTRLISRGLLRSCPRFETGSQQRLMHGRVPLVESRWRGNSLLVGSAEMQERHRRNFSVERMSARGAGFGGLWSAGGYIRARACVIEFTQMDGDAMNRANFPPESAAAGLSVFARAGRSGALWPFRRLVFRRMRLSSVLAS